jgi:hypothetical protein
VDPLFYDSTDGVIRQTTVIHLGSSGTNAAKLQGTFKIVFYDVFGEKYVTKPINAAWSADGNTRIATAASVREALEALPNGVISANNQDVTATPPEAVTVSMHSATAGTHTTDGGIGAGAGGESGAGLGTVGGFGSEFTVTFKSNPGVLKSIELDTRQIQDDGVPEYWVANARQGEFASRYTDNKGRINTLKYGSKLVFTNDDWSTAVGTGALVKIGGQEFITTAAAATHLTLNEPFLGASIVPVLTDTGTTASAFTLGPSVGTPQTPDQLTVAGVDTTIKAAALAAGAKIYINQCALTTVAPNIASSGTALDVADRAAGNHDCAGDFIASASIIYRRSDDPNNQNLYMTYADVGSLSAKSVILKRGSPTVYFTDVLQDNAGTADQAVSNVGGGGTDDGKITFKTAAKASPIDSLAFVNGFGPIKLPAVAAGDQSVTATTATEVTSIWTAATVATGDKVQYPYFLAVSGSDSGVATGKIVIINGRRYKVKSRTGTDAAFTLTENFAGGQLQQICASCITEYTKVGTGVTSSAKLTLAAGSRLLVSGYVQEDYLTTLTAAEADDVSLATSGYTLKAGFENIAGAAADTTGQTRALYRKTDDERTKIVIVTTEAAASSAKVFQYVAQCSNRGTCDAGTGLCKCFKGYSNDNCDTQNMLAA